MGVPVSMMEPLPRPTAQCEALVEVRLGPTDQLFTRCETPPLSQVRQKPSTVRYSIFCPSWFSNTMFAVQGSLSYHILTFLFLVFAKKIKISIYSFSKN